jgi:hypothetical protein
MGFKHFLHLLPLKLRSFRVQPLIKHFFGAQTQYFPLSSFEEVPIKRWDHVEPPLFLLFWLTHVETCLFGLNPMLLVFELRDIGGFCWML